MTSDVVVMFLAFVGGFALRFSTGLFQGPSEFLRAEHFSTLVLFVPVWIIVHGLNGLYVPRVMGTVFDQASGLLKAISLASLLILALGFYTQTNYFMEKRLVHLFGWTIALSLNVPLRLFLLRRLYQSQFGGHKKLNRILIVGAGVEGTRFLQRVRSSEALNYDVVGFVDDDPAKHGNEIDGVRVLGPVDDLPSLSEEAQADQVFVAIPSLGQEGTLAMMSRCMKAQLPVRLVSDILHLIASDTQVETIDGVPTYDVRTEGGSDLARFSKRAFDLAVSSALLLAFFPLFLFIAALIKIFSPGPVLFKQVRAGLNGREFTMMKFRTMRLETDDSIHREYATRLITGEKLDFADEAKDKEEVFKMTKDPRVTPVGTILRRTSLDELPQLLNVWLGDMSVVGPRPPIFYELNHYKEWHRKRLRAKPGLTGLWQVSGRSTVPFDEMVLLDLYYIDHWSLKTDLEILFRTIPVVLSGEGAY
ncbi:MAG: sugar transferase [Gemmatimonadetes bacterium]|nr:sugar transferase [Gemmatimonadota bacterium]